MLADFRNLQILAEFHVILTKLGHDLLCAVSPLHRGIFSGWLVVKILSQILDQFSERGSTIEKTFEDLLRLTEELDEEEERAVREGLDMESLAIFDLLKKSEFQVSYRHHISVI